MMVLGNIVAVTSIIAVVSLIQGMNSYVADALVSEVGIGTFRVDRVGVITDEEQEREALPPQPGDHEARGAGRPQGRPGDRRRDGRIQQPRERHVPRRDASRAVRIRGVSSEYDQFSGYEPTMGRLPTPARDGAQPAGLLPGLRDRREAVQGAHRPSTA